MSSQDMTLSPAQAEIAIMTCLDQNQPVFLDGGPGVGKSELYAQIADNLFAKKYGYTRDHFTLLDPDGNPTKNRPYFRDIRAALHDPVDFTGLPHLDKNGKMSFAASSLFPHDPDSEGLLFFDEANRAPVLTQNALFQIVLDRRSGEYELPKGYKVIAAGNRESDGGGVMRMPQALANRFIHIHLEPNADDWCKWAVQSNINPMLIAFMRYRPELLYQFSQNEHAFPTPRSWSFVNNIIDKTSQDIQGALIQGAVGHGAAVEFEAFMRTFRNLPNIDMIMLNPQSAVVPEDIAQLYAISAALASRARPDNFEAIMQYLDRVPIEYAVFSIKDATLRDPMLCTERAFAEWTTNHSDVI